MKDLLNRLFLKFMSHMNGDKAVLSESAVQNATSEWIVSLKENEIFVFGCRNSGRHWDGASAFALKHFGAIMGQREGRQGQSYAIPTIGGVIGLKEIRKSVATFKQSAARVLGHTRQKYIF